MNQDIVEKSHKKTRKRLLLIVVSILSFLILLVGISFIIDMIERDKNKDQEIDYNFYPVDFDENIFDDRKYIELTEGEFMRYCDLSTNLTVGIDKASAKQQGSEVEFIVEMIYKIINGDNDGYNACFSKKYYEKHSPKEKFTMQKIYDVLITKQSSETVTENENFHYTKSVYILEYKIYHNNGSFRRDIGDGSKKQYITITDSSGKLLIDSIATVNVK